MALPQSNPPASFRKQVFTLLGESYGDKTLVLCPTAFVRLFDGDHQAAILLSQILYWSERSKDPDGWFYKSYADWRAETGLSEAQVRRIVNGDPRVHSARLTLRDLGVETLLKKVKRTGAPTLHYRIRPAQFLAALERLMGQGDPQHCAGSILNIVGDEPRAESGMNAEQCVPSSDPDSKIDSKEEASEDQSPSNPAHPPDEDSDLEIFFAFEDRFGHLKTSLKPPLRQQLARLGAGRVGEVLGRCASRGRSWHYVLKALANEQPAAIPSSVVQDWGAVVHTGKDGEAPIAFMQPDPDPEFPASERVQLPLGTGADATLTPIEAWSRAYHQLELQLDRATFEACLRRSKLVDFEPESRTLVIALHSSYAREQCEQRLNRTLTRILADVNGRSVGLGLRFVEALPLARAV